MNNRIQNIVLKSISYIIIVVGVYLTFNIIGDGNPPGMSDAEFEQLAIREAKADNLQDQMTQVELDQWVVNRGQEIKEEQTEVLYNDVSTMYGFTYFIIMFSIILVLLAFLYLVVINPKKAIMTLVKIAAVGVVLLIVYNMADTTVPQALIDNEAARLVPEDDRMYTPENWQLASFFWVSFEVLAGVAVVGIIAGLFAKFIK